MPEMPIDRLGTGCDENGEALYPNILTRTLHLRDGSDLHFTAQEHAGPMAARVQRQHREERIRQLIGRLRAFYREDTTACYVIGQAIPEDLIVDEACTWGDLVGSSSAMWDIVRQAGGILSARAMLAASPEGGDYRRYQGWIERLPMSVCDAYHGVIVDGSGTGVPGHVADVAAFLEGHVGVDMATAILTPLHAPAAPEGKPADAIEERLGDRATRHAAEQASLARVRELVQRRGEWKAGGLQYRGGTGELEMKKAPIGVWAAMETLRDPWLQRDDVAVPAIERRVA